MRPAVGAVDSGAVSHGEHFALLRLYLRGIRQDDSARTSFEAPTEIHHKERAAFANELAKHLDLAIAQGRCPALALIASNPFLGELKARLGPASAKAVVATSPTDLTRCTLRELTHHAGTLLQQVQ